MANNEKDDIEIAELLHTSWLTVLRTRRKFVEGGLSFALNELSRAGRLPKIDDKVETILTTLAQSQPPDGRVRWTLQLLAVIFILIVLIVISIIFFIFGMAINDNVRLSD